MKEKNNKKNVIIIMIIILILAIGLGLGGYFVIKSINKKPKPEVTNQNVEVTLTSEDAYKLIENKRKELNYDTWITLSAEVQLKGDDNNYYVYYEDVQVGGGGTDYLSTIFHYKDGKWEFDIPGSSGWDEEYLNKYNFADYDSPVYFELTDEIALNLLESKRNEFGYDSWYATEAKVIQKGDNNYYMVSYKESYIGDEDGNLLETIFHYENGKWEFHIPGSSGWDEEYLKEYNFVDIK